MIVGDFWSCEMGVMYSSEGMCWRWVFVISVWLVGFRWENDFSFEFGLVLLCVN